MNFKRVFHSFYLLSLVSLGMLVSCKSDPTFSVSGEVEGGADKSIVLEKSDFQGRWYAVDSVRVASNGKFKIEADAPASPEIYRLSLDGKFIYLPVDSIESLKVVSPASKFGFDFSVEGTEQAANMASFEKELLKLPTNDDAKKVEFKKNVFNKYLKDSHGGIIGYYVLTKVVDGKPLYDPADPTDAKYFGAVATALSEFRPNDPHFGMLRDITLEAMRRRHQARGEKRVIEAPEISMIDIALNDENGREVKLSNVVGKGKPVVVIFSLMNHSDSPALNKALSDIYNSKGGGVEFYQVSLDNDHYAWREAARNLRWITVIDPQGQTSDALRQYNVGVLPTFFIYDAAGSLNARVQTVDELRKKI